MSGHHRSAIVYGDGLLGYDFGPQHPLRPERISAGFDLLRQTGLWQPENDTLPPQPAGEDEIALVHDPAYIRAVQEAGSGWFPAGELARFGIGPGDNPAFPTMHAAAALVTGGSIEPIRRIMDGSLDHAFNPAGGLHHAHRARASGFCIYNDPAAAAAEAVTRYGARVAYLDFDCHHGDGVQWLFYDSPNVLTLSFHESGRFLFPGTGDIKEIGEGSGLGYSLNLPFAPFTQDGSWRFIMEDLVPRVVRWFRPEVIISSHGADTHVWDPLTHMALTTASFFATVQLVHALAHELCEGRWLAVGSGGYDWRHVVPRSWSIVWSEMTGRELPDCLPGAWLDRWATDERPFSYLDDPGVSPEVPRRAEIEHANAATARQMLELWEHVTGG